MVQTYKVHWTKSAVADLDEILDYINAERRGAARKLYNQIRKKCSLLKSNPARYRRIPELAEVGIRNFHQISVSSYIVFYKLTQDSVQIIAVLDGRRGYETFLFNRLIRS